MDMGRCAVAPGLLTEHAMNLPRWSSITTPALVAAVLLAGARTASATVHWRGDFETGDTSQWSEEQVVAADRLQVVTDPVREGRHALRVEVRQGDDPLDASGNRSELLWRYYEKEGTDRVYAWSTLWPDDYPSADTWQLFVQWHHTGNSGSPPVEFYVVGEEILLRVDAEEVVWRAPLERGRWHDFVFRVRWSSDPQDGLVELYHDGQLVVPERRVANMYSGQDNLMKIGLYRDDSIEAPAVLYHDGMTVADTVGEVLPAAAPPLPPGVRIDPIKLASLSRAAAADDSTSVSGGGGCQVGGARGPAGGALAVVLFAGAATVRLRRRRR